MKFFIVLIMIVMITANCDHSFSQVSTQWRSNYNGIAGDTDIVTSVAVDTAGNVYVTGCSAGSGTGKDFATIKYSPSGMQLWAMRYNNDEINLDDIANEIALDALGNVYVTGQSRGIFFDDYLTIKYSPSGDLLWKARYNGKGNDNDIASDIKIDGLGNTFVTGYSVGASTSEDFTTIKYNPAGEQQWLASYNNPEADDIDIATSLSLDNSGNVFVAGFSIGAGSQEDYALVKYNSSGNELWNKRYNGPGNSYDITSAMTIDNSGNVYVTGYSFGNGSEEDYATVKYNIDGDLQWATRYDGPSGSFDIPRSIAEDNSGNIYVTGYSFDNTTYEDFATIKYDPNGNEVWARRFNGQGDDFDIAAKVKTDSKGNIYVTGYSYEQETNENFTTIKYNSDGVQQWTEIYNGEDNGKDIPSDLAVDIDDNVYVAGYGSDGLGNVDYITLKYSQTTGVNNYQASIPQGYLLNQNYPNPFNPSTVIGYQLRSRSDVSIKIFNINGKEVSTLVNKKQDAGSYKVEWNAVEFASGIYFYKLDIGGRYNDTKRMILLK
ncbi:MAG: SBBP repeat-containing protein [bacterium]|nr:SBBP repeat-containing protein [bacterium]